MEAKEFGQYLKSLRKGKKMTIRKLELYSTVSNAYLSQLENGKRETPSPDILKKLSGPLGVSYEVLMEKAGHIDPKEGDEERKNDESITTIKQLARKYNLDLNDPLTIEMFQKVMEVVALAKNKDTK